VADLDRAVALNPKEARFLVRRGEALKAKGEFDRAVADFDRALAIAPNDKMARDLKQAALTAKGSPSAPSRSAIPTDAAAQETGSTAGAAQSPKAARQLADAKAAYDRKDFNGVIRLLKSVLEAEPQNLTAWRMRASAYFSKREFDNAIADLEHVLAVKPDDSTANAMMGDVWREKGDQDKALASFGRAIELDPKNSSALNNRGLLR